MQLLQELFWVFMFFCTSMTVIDFVFFGGYVFVNDAIASVKQLIKTFNERV